MPPALPRFFSALRPVRRSRTASGQEPEPPSQVLFIGGRSGVGKTSAALELHGQLAGADVRHAVIDGDNLDLAHPAPWEAGLAEQNLAAMWGNYRALGYSRLVYTNTVSVLEAGRLAAAMGGQTQVTPVLLTCSDETALARLATRESGHQLQLHFCRSVRAARTLDEQAPAGTVRIATDGRTPQEVAGEIYASSGWGGGR